MNPGELFSVDMVTKERVSELIKEVTFELTKQNISTVKQIVHLEDAFEGNPFTILGFWGGLRVVSFAVLHPIRVHRMIVNATKTNILKHIDFVFKEYI
jgi:hypothetical protein